MFDFDFGVSNLEMKRAVVLITTLIDNIVPHGAYYKALKEISDEFEKSIKQYNEMVEEFDKTGKP